MFLLSVMAQRNIVGNQRIESARLQRSCEALQGVVENVCLAVEDASV